MPSPTSTPCSRKAAPTTSTTWCDSLQIRFLTVPLVLLALILAGEAALNSNDLRLLWAHPLGDLVLAASALSLLVGFVVYLGACRVLNWLLPDGQPTREKARLAVFALVVAPSFLGFCVPIFYTVVALPQDIHHIQANSR